MAGTEDFDANDRTMTLNEVKLLRGDVERLRAEAQSIRETTLPKAEAAARRKRMTGFLGLQAIIIAVVLAIAVETAQSTHDKFSRLTDRLVGSCATANLARQKIFDSQQRLDVLLEAVASVVQATTPTGQISPITTAIATYLAQEPKAPDIRDCSQFKG